MVPVFTLFPEVTIKHDGLNKHSKYKYSTVIIVEQVRIRNFLVLIYKTFAPLIPGSHMLLQHKHFLFDILFSVGCMLLAVRFGKFLEAQDSDLGNIPVNFFPVYSNLHVQLRTTNDTQLMTQIPHICSISILRKGLRLKDRRSGKLCHLYICVLLISDSWDNETNPGPESRSDSHFPCGTVMSVLVGRTEGFVAILAMSGIT